MQHSSEFEKISEESRKRIKEISVQDAATLFEKGGVLLIDVREDHEWAKGRAKGATHLGRGIIERDIHNIAKKDQTMLLYCGGGYRSALAADNLQKMGYNNVKSVSGGWKAWVAAGLPTES
jgi:rhodanese-related sulfurtransferase